jgi:hypothetical protein
MKTGGEALDDLTREDLQIGNPLEIGGGEEIRDVRHCQTVRRSVLPCGASL